MKYGISNAEFVVLSLIADGRSHVQIAKRLCRSTRTIENHERALRRKLNVKNRVSLARAAYRLGVLVP